MSTFYSAFLFANRCLPENLFKPNVGMSSLIYFRDAFCLKKFDFKMYLRTLVC